jgi:hypothetical protein
MFVNLVLAKKADDTRWPANPFVQALGQLEYAATHGFPWNVDAPNITVHEHNSRWILDVVTFDRLAPHIGYTLLTHAIVVATLARRRATRK